MISNIWTKTVLSAYPYLIKVADAIDRMVERRSLNSFYVTSSNFASNNIYDIANQLIDLSERKITLINLKVLVDDTLKKCNLLHAKLLIAKYISKKKCVETSQILNIPLRTYFRKIKKAESEFEDMLNELGFDEKKLEDMLKDEEWIIDLKQRYEKINEEEIVLSQKEFKKVAF